MACIERLGCVQIDSISVVDRSQRLVLASRCGKLAPDTHDALLRSGRVFEYWAHEACLLPAVDEPHFRRDKREGGQFHRWFGPILSEHRELADEVMAVARERDEISARDFGGAGQGYWEWTPAKRVLEALWTAGELAIAGRVGMERRYALPERVLPEEILGAPEPRSRPLGACRSSARCGRGASPARRAFPTTTASRASAARSPPPSRSSSARACWSGCA